MRKQLYWLVVGSGIEPELPRDRLCIVICPLGFVDQVFKTRHMHRHQALENLFSQRCCRLVRHLTMLLRQTAAHFASNASANTQCGEQSLSWGKVPLP